MEFKDTIKETLEILTALGEETQKVNNYIEYIVDASRETKANNQLKNPFLLKVEAKKFVHLYNKVSSMGLILDGQSVMITSIKGKPNLTFTYHAYKNIVLVKYPETIFDFQVVKEGDTFDLMKNSGKVEYTHVFGDPFDNERKINGAYGVVKNSQGEFVNTINTKEIKKVRKTAKTDYIWSAWEEQMILKTIIKRLCKIYFHDITKGLDATDNELNHKKFDQDASDESHRKTRILNWISDAENIAILNECKADIRDDDGDLLSAYNHKVELLESKQLAHEEKNRE